MPRKVYVKSPPEPEIFGSQGTKTSIIPYTTGGTLPVPYGGGIVGIPTTSPSSVLIPTSQTAYTVMDQPPVPSGSQPSIKSDVRKCTINEKTKRDCQYGVPTTDIKFMHLQKFSGAACALPFITQVGKVDVDIRGRLDEHYDVNPENMAKMRCYIDNTSKASKPIYCTGTNIFGDAVDEIRIDSLPDRPAGLPAFDRVVLMNRACSNALIRRSNKESGQSMPETRIASCRIETPGKAQSQATITTQQVPLPLAAIGLNLLPLDWWINQWY